VGVWLYRNLGLVTIYNLERINTLIISDLHLGNISNPNEVINILHKYRFNRLILCGDIFDSLNFSRIRKPEWRLLGEIRKVSKRAEVEWVEGNHDIGIADVISHLVGSEVHMEYQWQIGDKKFLAIHGHQFDNLFWVSPKMSKIGSFFYRLLTHLPWGKSLTKLIFGAEQSFSRSSERIKERAVHHAKHLGVNCVICGHTHKAERKFVDKIEYVNAGGWTERPFSYVVIHPDGIVSLKFYT